MEYEDRLRISTPEGVELELTLAGVGSRFTASLIDHAIQGLLVVASIVLFTRLADTEVAGGQVGGDGDGSLALGAAVVTLWTFLVFFVYDVLFEVRAGGRTPGKRLTGLRVVRTGGQPIGFIPSAIRNVVRIADALPGFYGVGMAVVFASRRNQRLGDLAAGTVVVRERTGGRERRRKKKEPAAPPAAVAVATSRVDASGWDVSAVTGDEVATVRRFLERRPGITPAGRGDLAGDLAARLRPRVAGAPDDLAPEAFLEALADAKAARS